MHFATRDIVVALLGRRGSFTWNHGLRWALALLMLVPTTTGCRSFSRGTQPVIARGRAREIVRESLQRVSYEDPQTQINPYRQVSEPKTIRNRADEQLRELSLGEAIRLGLENNPLIRQNGVLLSPNNPLLSNPDQAASVYDTAIKTTDVFFQTRGIHAALSDFDPTLTSSLTFGRTSLIQDNGFLLGGVPPGDPIVSSTGQLDMRIDKNLRTGGTVSLLNQWNHLSTNQTSRLFESDYEGFVGVEFRQPLLAGSWFDYTETAGPIGLRSRGLGVNQGVRIALINEKIAGIDFELAVRNLIKDIVDAYWTLHQSHQEYVAELGVRDAAKLSWEQIQANVAFVGGAAEAQAEATYLEVLARTENALANVYDQETRLRRLLGLPNSDGFLLKPITKPVITETRVNWDQALGDALESRTELQKQRLQIQSLEWQVKAAKSLTRPRLDFTSGYRVNGFGKYLYAADHGDGALAGPPVGGTTQGLQSALGTLSDNRQTSWSLGVNFSMPFYFRLEQSQVHNLQLRLIKARRALAEQEREITAELSLATQSVAKWYKLVQTNTDRLKATERWVQSVQAVYEAGSSSQDQNVVDRLLRARQSYAQAISEHARSVSAYNQALAELEHRKGQLLRTHLVELESPAPPGPETSITVE